MKRPNSDTIETSLPPSDIHPSSNLLIIYLVPVSLSCCCGGNGIMLIGSYTVEPQRRYPSTIFLIDEWSLPTIAAMKVPSCCVLRFCLGTTYIPTSTHYVHHSTLSGCIHRIYELATRQINCDHYLLIIVASLLVL